MRKYFTNTLLLFTLSLAAMLLVGCGAANKTPTHPANEPQISNDGPVTISENIPETGLIDSQVVSDSGSQNIDESPEAISASEQPNYCLDCHTDQKSLIDTAKPEEPVVEESEGEG